mgnify:CR=1 FL=1
MTPRLAAAFALLPEYLGWHVLLSAAALAFLLSKSAELQAVRVAPRSCINASAISSGDFSTLNVHASAGGARMANWLASKAGGMKWPLRFFNRASIKSRGPVKCTNRTRGSPF